MANDTITFYDNHTPALEAGSYTVTVEQELHITDDTTPVTPAIPSQTIDFHVSGPRFVLEPSLIHTVFPPKGG